MKETIKLIAVLTIICLGAGALLAVVNNVTAVPIREAERAEKMEAVKSVLPPYDNTPDQTVCRIVEKDTEWAFYVASSNGVFCGAAVEAVSAKGYGGDISVMAGFDARGNVNAVEILKHKETPGLGAKIAEASFTGQFEDKHVKDARWAVKKDGGDIDQITAATISSRAVVDAVSVAGAVYLENEDKIRQTIGQAPPVAGEEKQ